MSRTTRFAATAAAVALGATALAGCGGSSDGSSSSSSSSAGSSSSSAKPSPSASRGKPAAKTATLTITDYEFSGARTGAPGTKITVTNKDSEAHTVTADKGGAFDLNIPPGKSASLTAPSKAGSYPYHCTFHSNMHGTLTVG